jgi:hypothetical protein
MKGMFRIISIIHGSVGDTAYTGRRTAWTCKITVGSRVFDARNFYDGHANAREDAAEVAFTYFNAVW